jgi:hypothetical protein
LLTLKTLVRVFGVKLIYGLPIAGVDVVEDAEVDTDAVACINRVHVGFLGELGVVGFRFEGDEPLAGRLSFKCGFF